MKDLRKDKNKRPLWKWEREGRDDRFQIPSNLFLGLLILPHLPKCPVCRLSSFIGDGPYGVLFSYHSLLWAAQDLVLERYGVGEKYRNSE